jgi:glycine cleavage system regulatory protein
LKRSPGIIISLLILLLFCSMTGCGAKSQDLVQNQRTESVKEDAAGSPEAYSQSAPAPTAPEMERKIIQNANLDLEVEDVAQAMDRINAICIENGGYTVNSHLSRNDQRFSARLSIKVPQEKLHDIIASISQLGEVTYKVISTQDVTEEYYDADARLKAMKAKEERLLGLMSQAGNINDIISIENELGKTRAEIEVLSGRLKYLDNATAYSLIEIELRQAIPGAVKAPQGTMGKAVQGLISSINGLINFASHTVVAIFVILPWALVLFLLFLLLRYIYRKHRSRRTN